MDKIGGFIHRFIFIYTDFNPRIFSHLSSDKSMDFIFIYTDFYPRLKIHRFIHYPRIYPRILSLFIRQHSLAAVVFVGLFADCYLWIISCHNKKYFNIFVIMSPTIFTVCTIRKFFGASFRCTFFSRNRRFLRSQIKAIL